MRRGKTKTQDLFWEWRSEVMKLMNDNCYDERLNIRQPMSMLRTVYSLDDIEFPMAHKPSDTLVKFMGKLYDETAKAYPPYLTNEVLNQPSREEKM